MYKLITIYLLSFFLVISITTSCSITDGGPSTSTFTVEVDSISVPSEVNSSDTLSIHPFGRVGPTSCYSFKQFEASRSASSIDLKLVGELVEGDDIICENAIVQLDTTYEVPPPLEGPFEITIHQPDESTLTRTVEVNN